MEDASLLEYPCDFPLKILGHTQAGFAQTILDIVKRHAPDFDGSTIELRASKRRKYLSVTCIIRATSRKQLDDLYRDLCDHPMVVMVL
jgi:putative lipoic acid-binding regulatory protein